MYTLRRITKEDLESNTSLGNEYSLINRETNYEKFRETFFKVFNEECTADSDNTFAKECYGFVVSQVGEKIHPLYKKQWNYIMTESGKTFSNLTYK
jgi:hypothetical protein